MPKETAAARDMRKAATANAEEIRWGGPPITDLNLNHAMNVEQRRIQCWDVDAGYAAAREKYKAEFLGRRFGLQVEGFCQVAIYDDCGPLSSLLDNESYLPAAEIHSRRHVFDAGFSSLDKLLHQYYQSEFAPCFCSMLKMGPMGDEVDDSYRWHVDNGPSSHLKLIIYLNDDHDGATAVMSRQDSRKFIDAGYLEGERLFHVDEFAEQHGISYTPYKIQPKAGSGLIFEPTNILHKGMYPTFGERRVFQIGIIPWGKPWEDFYDEHWAKGYSNSNGFPRYVLGDGAKVA